MALFTRRRLLGAGLVTGGAVGAAAVGLVAVREPAPAVAGLRVLTPAQHRTMQLVARTHVPPGGPLAWSAADVDVAGLFDGFLADQPDADQRDAALALDLVDLGPLLFERRWTTFAALDDEQRLDHWNAWAVAPQATRREIWWSLARFVGMAVYDQPGAWPGIGYLGPSLARRRG
ncbi:MAG: hypothetical protein FJ100_18535 [Deltaproteobacteria bacterium]|nr:hypothetical protein [Deltaproteobacteria bacterium]